ncbi:hypothetical protein PRIPAC_84453, partial [Pristionchus pacificus]
FRMTDDSKFVLRWEVDNATAKFAAGTVESEVFHKRGFEWTVTAERDVRGATDFTVRCNEDRIGPWKCESDLIMNQHLKNGGVRHVWKIKKRACFNENNCSWVRNCVNWTWNNITDSDYLINDKVTFELHFNIISSQRTEFSADLDKFAIPNELSNVILKI